MSASPRPPRRHDEPMGNRELPRYWLPLATGLIWIASGIKQCITPSPDANSYPVLLGLGVASLTCGIWGAVQRRSLIAFHSWLLEVGEEITAGGWELDGQEVDANTILSQDTLTFSLVFWSVQIPSGYFIGRRRRGSNRLICLLGSALFGWWCLPRGAVNTLRSIAGAAGKGRATRVGDLLFPKV